MENLIDKINFLKIDCEGAQYEIIESLDEPLTEDAKYWGSFPSREDAIAHRIGLIRAGKCQPQ